MPVVADVGLFHRLGVAVREETGTVAPDGGTTPTEPAASWFAGVLGAEVEASRPEPGDTHSTTILWLGRSPFAVFAATADDTRGTIGRYLERFGPGLHSLAWRVRDLQGAEDAPARAGLHDRRCEPRGAALLPPPQGDVRDPLRAHRPAGLRGTAPGG